MKKQLKGFAGFDRIKVSWLVNNDRPIKSRLVTNGMHSKDGGGEMNERYGLLKWQISHIAHGLTRAKRLEKHRADFFEELYESIVYPSANLDYNNPSTHSAKVDNQAIRIIELKERYDKKVQKEYEKHFRWKDLLTIAQEKDRYIMVRYFQKKKYVEPHIIMGLLDRLEECIEHEEFMLEKEKEEQAKEAYKSHRNDFFDKYRVKPLIDNSDKQMYLIGGRSVYMTTEEYQAHLDEQEAKRLAFDKRMQEIRGRSEATWADGSWLT